MRLHIVNPDHDVPGLISAYGKVGGSEIALALRPRERRGALLIAPKLSTSFLWISGAGGDGPAIPTTSALSNDANRVFDELRKDVPRTGSAILRGTWKGTLDVDVEGRAVIKLERKVASYATLQIHNVHDTASKGGSTWRVRLERGERWFAGAKTEERTDRSLAGAIQQGLALMTGVVGAACTARDTQRRNVVDPVFAQTHPYRPPKAGKDALDRARVLQPPKEAKPPKPPKPPKEAKPPKPPKEAKPPKPPRPSPEARPSARMVPPPALLEVPAPMTPSCPTSVEQIRESVAQEAASITSVADSLWGKTEIPSLLTRAASLIRHAEALVRSPLCTGAEQREAFSALSRAADAYTAAREAILAGQAVNARSLKQIAEQVSLAAAKAARACAGGKPGKAAKCGTPALRAEARQERPAKAAKPKALSQDQKDELLLGAFQSSMTEALKQMAQQGLLGGAKAGAVGAAP